MSHPDWYRSSTPKTHISFFFFGLKVNPLLLQWQEDEYLPVCRVVSELLLLSIKFPSIIQVQVWNLNLGHYRHQDHSSYIRPTMYSKMWIMVSACWNYRHPFPNLLGAWMAAGDWWSCQVEVNVFQRVVVEAIKYAQWKSSRLISALWLEWN